jgi:hypothetical protein
MDHEYFGSPALTMGISLPLRAVENRFAHSLGAPIFRTASGFANTFRIHTNCSTIEGVRFL